MLFGIKIALLSALIFMTLSIGPHVETGLQTWSEPVLRLSDLFFGPMLAVLFWRHPIFPPKLAIEIGEVGKATIVCHLSNRLVGLPQEPARVAKAKIDQCFDKGA